MARKGADKLLKENGPRGLNSKKFQESQFYFNEQNSQIPSRFRDAPDDAWTLSTPTREQTCKFRSPPGDNSPVRQVRFDQTRFFGVKHLSGMQEPSERDQARTQMEKDPNRRSFGRGDPGFVSDPEV